MGRRKSCLRLLPTVRTLSNTECRRPAFERETLHEQYRRKFIFCSDWRKTIARVKISWHSRLPPNVYEQMSTRCRPRAHWSPFRIRTVLPGRAGLVIILRPWANAVHEAPNDDDIALMTMVVVVVTTMTAIFIFHHFIKYKFRPFYDRFSKVSVSLDSVIRKFRFMWGEMKRMRLWIRICLGICQSLTKRYKAQSNERLKKY